MAGSLYLLALLYGIYLLKEVPQKAKPNQQNVTKKSLLADFFDPAHLKETFLVAFRCGAKNRRTKVLVLMTIIFIVIGPQHGKFERKRCKSHQLYNFVYSSFNFR